MATPTAASASSLQARRYEVRGLDIRESPEGWLRQYSIIRARIQQVEDGFDRSDPQCGRRRRSACPECAPAYAVRTRAAVPATTARPVIAARPGRAPLREAALDGRAVGAEPYKPSSGGLPDDGRLLQPCPGTSPGGQRVPSWRQHLPGSPPPESPFGWRHAGIGGLLTLIGVAAPFRPSRLLVPLVTPFDADGHVDLPALERLAGEVPGRRRRGARRARGHGRADIARRG